MSRPHRIFALAVALALVGCQSAPERDDTVGVPARFQGEWNRNLADCGTAANDSNLRLTADRIVFHDSAGQITSAIVTDRIDLAVTARMEGEGQAWTGTWRYRLSDAHNTLTDVTSANAMVRYRCP